MKSITIHNLDDRLEQRIREKAIKQGTSLNKTIQMLLQNALGLNNKPSPDHRSDFLDIFGAWNEKDAAEFEKNSKIFSRIDKEDWK